MNGREAFVLCVHLRNSAFQAHRTRRFSGRVNRLPSVTSRPGRCRVVAQLGDEQPEASRAREKRAQSSTAQGARSQGVAKSGQTGSAQGRSTAEQSAQTDNLSAPATPPLFRKDTGPEASISSDQEDGLVRPEDPSFLRTELERRRNQPVRTIAERRRMLREMRRRQAAAEEQRTLREKLETERALPTNIDIEQLESVPLVRETLSGREQGEDYWLDLNELARQPGEIRLHERPRLSLLSKFLSGGRQTNPSDGKLNEEASAIEEEIEWRRLLQELKRTDRVSMQFQELMEEVPMIPGESVEEALSRSRLGRDQAVLRSSATTDPVDDIDPAMLFQLKELEPVFSRIDTSVQRRENGSVLVIRRYVPRISARILELRDRRLRRKLRLERGRLSSKMQDRVRAELVLPYSQNWIALMVGVIGLLAVLTWLFGQSGPVIELPDL
jgi:hypothetical protein